MSSIISDLLLEVGKKAVVEGGKEVGKSLIQDTVSGFFGAESGGSSQDAKIPTFEQGIVRSQRNVESVARGTPVESVAQPQRSGTGVSYHQALIKSFGRVATEGTIGRSISKTDLG